MANNYNYDPYSGQKATGGATMNGQQGSQTQASLQNADAYSKSKGDPFAAYGNLSAAWSKALGPKGMTAGPSLPGTNSGGGGGSFTPFNPDIGYGPGQVPTFAPPSGSGFQPFRMPGEGASAPAGSTRVFGEPVPQGGTLQARNPFANPVANPPTTFPSPGPNPWQPLDVNYYDELRKKIVGPKDTNLMGGTPQFGDYRAGPFGQIGDPRTPAGMTGAPSLAGAGTFQPMGIPPTNVPAPTNPWQPINPGYYDNQAFTPPGAVGDPLGGRGFNPGGGNPDGLPPTSPRPPATPSTQPTPAPRPPATPSTQPVPPTWTPAPMPGEGSPAPPGSTTPFGPSTGNPFANPVNDPWGTTFPGPTTTPPNIPGAAGGRAPGGMTTGSGGGGFAPNGQPLGTNGVGRRLVQPEDPTSASGKRSQTYQWFNKEDGKQEMWETDANGNPTRKVQTGMGPGSGAQVIDFPTGGSTSQVGPGGSSTTTTTTGTTGAPNSSTTFDPNVMPTSNVGDWFDPIANKALEDVRRQAMHAGSLTGATNSGGFIPGMTEELGNVANMFAAKKGDLQQQDQQFKAGQLLDKYKFDNTQQLQRWIEENQTELARYGIDTNALVSRYQADQGLAAAGLGASASMYGAGTAADASRYNAMLDYQQGMAGIGANYGLGQDRLGYDYWNTGQNLGYNYWNSDAQRQQDNVFNQRGYDLGVYGLNRDVYGMDQAQRRYLMDLMWRMSPGGQMGGGYFPLPDPFAYRG